MERRKICVVTGTRADYGLLHPVMERIRDDQHLILQLVVTGMHLSPEFGFTVSAIEEDGFQVDARVECLLSSDTPVGISKSVGLAVIGCAEAYARLQPDFVVLLGDRFEILAAAQAALFAKIPIGHIAGGDVTEGAFDEAIRHSITKMASLHFVTQANSERRVRQLGENPAHVYLVGSPGIDQILNRPLLSREQVEAAIGAPLRTRNLLVTFHPVTQEIDNGAAQFEETLEALGRLGDDVGLFFTYPNADNRSRHLIATLNRFVAAHSNAKAFRSLGSQVYLNLMSYVDAVVGNSSSGLYEAPTLKIATVNIGHRQEGRPFANSVLKCAAKRDAIFTAIQQAFVMDCSGTVNPYGDGGSSQRIVDILRTADLSAFRARKGFYDWQEAQ